MNLFLFYNNSFEIISCEQATPPYYHNILTNDEENPGHFKVLTLRRQLFNFFGKEFHCYFELEASEDEKLALVCRYF